MIQYNTPSIVKLFRRTAVSLCLVGVVALAYASSGGGDKKNMSPFKNNFTPIRSNLPFTLKSSPVYSGSTFRIHEVDNNKVALHTMVTYQRGNTTFILPFRYKVNIGDLNTGSKSNLQFLGVKINMPK